MITDPVCVNRLYNWKFHSAVSTLPIEVEVTDHSLVMQLSERYGNCGWFDGIEGQAVAAKVAVLIGSVDG